MDGPAVPIPTLVLVRRLMGERSEHHFQRPLRPFGAAQDTSD
jgi:hypothetical protein